MIEKKHQTILFVLLGVLVIVGNIYLSQSKFNQPNSVQAIKTNCQIDIAPCVLTDENNIYKISVEGEVKPLKKFLIKLQDKNQLINNAVIEFRMMDMEMGKNVFSFERMDLGIWEADVIIPVCTTGRRDWELELVLTSGDKLQKYIMNLVL